MTIGPITPPMSRDDPDDDAFARLVRRIDPTWRLLRAWPLGGGVSAEVTVIELERGSGERSKLIVRRHGEADRARNPHVARDEHALLRLLHARGLPVPRPVLVDGSGDVFPTPVLVVEFVEGETEFAPANLDGYLDQAATVLARIHGVGDSPALSFLPRLERAPGLGQRPARLDASLGEGRIREALAAAGPVPCVNEPGLLHGDFWPGNLLWRDGALVAVIDWEDAGIGDPLADLANSRLEFLWAFGAEAMTGLTSRYLARSAIEVGNLPYWDLVAALRPCGTLAEWGLEAATEQRMRERHAWFVGQALAELERGSR